ncbi:transcriptional regulator [Mycolicibacillus koreensis]|nr:transcriptional regulator [Mycolicibacillus koreensis]
MVDMCNRNELPHIMVGTHRRIPREAIDLLSAKHQPGGDRHSRSRWLHIAIARALLLDPDAVIAKARSNLARARADGAIDVHSTPYMTEWEMLLASDLATLIDAMLDPGDHAATLRSCSPFAGVLPQEEVSAIKETWRLSRTGDGERV